MKLEVVSLYCRYSCELFVVKELTNCETIMYDASCS